MRLGAAAACAARARACLCRGAAGARRCPPHQPCSARRRKIAAYVKGLMDDEDERFADFCTPVTVDVAPDYFDVIAEPMDLGTVRSECGGRPAPGGCPALGPAHPMRPPPACPA